MFLMHDIVDTPTNPTNISSMVQEYQSISSTVEITWNPPLNHDPQVDHYHYELIDRSNQSQVMDANTTNTSAILDSLPYNHDLSFSLSAVNCIGKTSPIIYHINIGKIHAVQCIKATLNFKILHTTLKCINSKN